MVSVEDIDKVFSMVLDGFKGKCGETNASMKRKLSNMSKDEIIDALLEMDLLNDNEQEVYSNLLDKWDTVKDKDLDKISPRFREAIEKLKEQMFYFEKKIFTHEKTEIPSIDEGDYQIENQNLKPNEIGSLEQKQIDNQNSFLDKMDWEEHGVGKDYFGAIYYEVNSHINYGDDFWKRVSKSPGMTENKVKELKSRVNSVMKDLDYMIDNAPSLNENTVLYRGGRIDLDIPVGGKGKFKSYSSTSYQESVAENFRGDGEYLIKIYAPQGTKGLNGNGRYMGSEGSTMGWLSEHEFLLGRGQEYVVLERNDRGEPKTATIVLV